MKKGSHFIKFYNVFAEEKSKYHLNKEELYLYGLLKMCSNIEDKTITTITVLHDISPLAFLSVNKKSKERIKRTLLTMRDKKIIHFQNSDIKINDTIIIEFEDNLIDESIGKGIKGHEQITFEEFNSFSSMLDLYIYFTVKRFDKIGQGFQCNYERWADILNLSVRQSISKIEDGIERNIIYRNIGDYTENELNTRPQLKQDFNTYRTTKFKEDEKTIATVKREQKEKKQDNKKYAESAVQSGDEYYDKELIEYTRNFADFNLYPDYDEYKFYEEVKHKIDERNGNATLLEKDFLKTANNRINLFKKNENSRNMYEKKHLEAKFDFEKERKDILVKEATHAVTLKNGEVIPLTDENVDAVDWNEIDLLLHGENDWTELANFQGMDMSTRKTNDRPYLMESGWELYKGCFKEGKLVNISVLNDLRSEAFFINEERIKQEESEEGSNIDVDMYNSYLEAEIKRKSPSQMVDELF